MFTTENCETLKLKEVMTAMDRVCPGVWSLWCQGWHLIRCMSRATVHTLCGVCEHGATFVCGCRDVGEGWQLKPRNKADEEKSKRQAMRRIWERWRSKVTNECLCWGTERPKKKHPVYVKLHVAFLLFCHHFLRILLVIRPEWRWRSTNRQEGRLELRTCLICLNTHTHTPHTHTHT